MYNDEELKALMGMGDLSSQQAKIDQQFALSKALRGSPMANKQRNDWGSQIGRAGSGIASAMGDYNAMKAQEGIAPKREKFFSDMLRENRKREGIARAMRIAMGEEPAAAEEEEQYAEEFLGE